MHMLDIVAHNVSAADMIAPFSTPAGAAANSNHRIIVLVKMAIEYDRLRHVAVAAREQYRRAVDRVRALDAERKELRDKMTRLSELEREISNACADLANRDGGLDVDGLCELASVYDALLS